MLAMTKTIAITNCKTVKELRNFDDLIFDEPFNESAIFVRAIRDAGRPPVISDMVKKVNRKIAAFCPLNR